jgi:hypothetical protein
MARSIQTALQRSIGIFNAVKMELDSPPARLRRRLACGGTTEVIEDGAIWVAIKFVNLFKFYWEPLG